VFWKGHSASGSEIDTTQNTIPIPIAIPIPNQYGYVTIFLASLGFTQQSFIQVCDYQGRNWAKQLQNAGS